MKKSHTQMKAPQCTTLDYVSPRQPKAKSDRRTRIQSLIEQIQLGCSFKSSELKAALGSVAWEEFRQGMQSSRIPKEVAKLLRPYQEALQRADALNRRPARPLGSPKQRFKMGCRANSAEMEYERASELLQCLFDDDPGIGRWFDRSVRFDVPEAPTLDADEMPRVRGSRSQYARPNVPRKVLDQAALVALFATLEACKTVNPTPALAWLLPLNVEAGGLDSVESAKSDADFACPAQKDLDWLL